MAKVADLLPGDVVDDGRWTAMFLGTAGNPLDEESRLVIWAHPAGRWSIAVLHPDREVGDVIPVSADLRRQRVAEILEHGGRGGYI